jgi:hypothetical protein
MIKVLGLRRKPKKTKKSKRMLIVFGEKIVGLMIDGDR